MKELPWYTDWRDDALRELMAKQGRLMDTHKLGDWRRWDFDAVAGTLAFSDETGPRVVADAQIVGTVSPTSWLWSWANVNWEGCSVREMHRVRQFGVENSIEELTTDYLYADDLNQLGWEMTGVTARVLGAIGAYRAPADNDAFAFVVCTSINFVS